MKAMETMPSPPLSLIIPVLNEAATITTTLRGLAPLRQGGTEVIVVDGGSRDGTPELARPHCQEVIDAPGGRARQMNRGAEAACGKILLFLHADTHLPDSADHHIRQALSRERCWGRFDIRLEGNSRLLPMVARAMNLRSRLTGIATGDQALFMTRAAFEAVGGFPDQPLMEDIAISRRLGRLSPPACLHSRVTSSGRRWDSQGPWRTIWLMWRLRWRYWRGAPPETLAREYRHVR